MSDICQDLVRQSCLTYVRQIAGKCKTPVAYMFYYLGVNVLQCCHTVKLRQYKCQTKRC
jgi:hypothetical protein